MAGSSPAMAWRLRSGTIRRWPPGFDLHQNGMKLGVLEIEQLVRAAARLAVDDVAEQVDDLALAAVLPAHQRLAFAHRHDQVGILLLMQRLVPLAVRFA